MKIIRRSTLMAGVIVLGIAGIARSEPAPPGLTDVAWQVLPNPCWASRPTVAEYALCPYPIRHVTDRALVTVPGRDGQLIHRVRIDGQFPGRRYNERVVIMAEGNEYWDTRLNAMAMRGFVVEFLDIMRWQDHRIYAETQRQFQLPRGRYAVALVYDVSSNSSMPEFMLGSVVTRFDVN